jgi:hypothetical protein
MLRSGSEIDRDDWIYALYIIKSVISILRLANPSEDQYPAKLLGDPIFP